MLHARLLHVVCETHANLEALNATDQFLYPMTDSVDLYNWAPLVQMLLLGALLGGIALLWLWRKHRKASRVGWLHALTLLTLFLTFDLVIFGAFTRLTDSGLGCPDWPGCYGNASPVGARHEIAAAQEAVPHGAVTHGKAWVEMIHRYLATSVGFLILVLTVASWLHWWKEKKKKRVAAISPLDSLGATTVAPSHAIPIGTNVAVHPAWPTLTLFWVMLQGAFGAWTVTMKLFPAIVTLHLLGGIILLILLCAQATLSAGHQRVGVSAGARWLMIGAFGVLMLQIALGGWVSTNYAVLACTTFPDCNGAWWPEMDFSQGFEIWRELGKSASGEDMSFSALVAIHYAHRLMAYLVIVTLAALTVFLWRVQALKKQAKWLLALFVLQFATGLSNVVLGWPLIAALLHTAGAAALAVLLTNVIIQSERLRRSA